MVGIRETVKQMVDAWWSRASAQERYGHKCGVTVDDVLSEIGIARWSNYSASRQAKLLINERWHELQQEDKGSGC